MNKMTREEAINELKYAREMFEFDPSTGEVRFRNDEDRRQAEAIEMAITALSQEQQSEWERDHEILKAYADGQESMKPCKDAISRQAAIDAIWDGVNMDIYTREVKECLEKLPSVSVAEKVGRWEEELKYV